ncbi:MAG: threonine synthase [Armatimonadetes bacterium]|nr:threonine synthase [Armatimonadota bacterium]
MSEGSKNKVKVQNPPVTDPRPPTPGWPGIIEAYRAFLPVTDATPVITLREGNTPLIPAPALGRRVGRGAQVYLKYEGLNPTGSFKDRGMTMAISKAAETGAQAVICASTGNTSASAAAYAARAGMKCVVLLEQSAGAIALGKLSQALIHGATVLAVEGNFDQALHLVRKISADYPIALVNSLNPYRIQGQKSGAFEVCDSLGRAPDYHCIPVGNAGNITAYWMGYKEYHGCGRIASLPRMIGFQAEGAAPIVRGAPVPEPKTLATAIKIGNPASWKGAEAARDESGGEIGTVTDEEILEAYRILAQEEGVFCEPASAASVAGLLKKAAAGGFTDDALIVCVLTGHGLKDPDRALAVVEKPTSIPATEEAVVKAIGFS